MISSTVGLSASLSSLLALLYKQAVFINSRDGHNHCGLYIQPAMQPHRKELPLKAPVEVPGITLCPGLGHMSARSQGMIPKGKLWKSKFGKIVDVHYTLVAGKLPVKGTFKYTKHFTDL